MLVINKLVYIIIITYSPEWLCATKHVIYDAGFSKIIGRLSFFIPFLPFKFPPSPFPRKPHASSSSTFGIDNRPVAAELFFLSTRYLGR